MTREDKIVYLNNILASFFLLTYAKNINHLLKIKVLVEQGFK